MVFKSGRISLTTGLPSTIAEYTDVKIDDGAVSDSKVWSSAKTDSAIAAAGAVDIDDAGAVSGTTVWSSSKTRTEIAAAGAAAGAVTIDDVGAVSHNKVWSSDKTRNEINSAAVTIDDGAASQNKVWSSDKTRIEIAAAGAAAGAVTIDDNGAVSNDKVWSSDKTRNEINSAAVTIDDGAASQNKVWSSDKTRIEIAAVGAAAGAVTIDDVGAVSNTKVWSSDKTRTEIDSASVAIDDGAASQTTVWSSNKTRTEIDSAASDLETQVTTKRVKLSNETAPAAPTGAGELILFNESGILKSVNTAGTVSEVASGGVAINDGPASLTTLWSSAKINATIAAAIVASTAPAVQVPKFTSGTASSTYIATASSYVATAPYYDAWKAFDGIPFNRWAGMPGDYDSSGNANANVQYKMLGHMGQWIKLQMPYVMRVSAVRVTIDPIADTYSQKPVSWVVLCSTDDTSYTVAYDTAIDVFVNGIANVTFTAPVTASYLVLVVRKVTGSGGNASITQIDYL